MSHGFPYRVTVWRRALASRPDLVRRWVLATPALLGAALLAIAIPTLGRLYSTEVGLTETLGARITVDTDCPDLYLYVALWPYDPDAGGDPVEATSHVVVDVMRDANDNRCTAIDLRFAGEGPGPLDLVDSEGEVALEEAGRVRFGDGLPTDPTADRVRLVRGHAKLRWPGLVRYSHRGHGWLNRWLGPSAAGVPFVIEWRPRSEGVEELDTLLTVQVMAPLDFEVSYADEWGVEERSQTDVQYAEERWSLNDPYLAGKVRFRTHGHEAKLNYVSLAGGAVIGLGITLLVETLIASLFRLERLLTCGPRGEPGSGRDAEKRDAEKRDAGTGPAEGRDADDETDEAVQALEP